MKAWLERRRLDRFHRRCDQLGIPGDVRRRFIRMAEATGKKLRAPDWYAGRAAEPELKGGSVSSWTAQEIRNLLLTKGAEAATQAALVRRDVVEGLESMWREKFERDLEIALEAAGLGEGE